MTEMSANSRTLSRLKIRKAAKRLPSGFFLLSAILVASVAVPPFHEGGYTVCILNNVFGIPCPGCGMTRAFLFLGHGAIDAALRLNINSLLVFSIIAVLWLDAAFTVITGKDIKVWLTDREKIIIYTAVGTVMILGWIYNLLLNPVV